MAEKLSPRDPLKVHYYGVVGMAWLASRTPESQEKALKAFEVAAREPNAIWSYPLAAAAIHADNGNLNGAREFVSAVLRQNPDASLATAASAIPMPVWRAAWGRMSNVGDLLVELGLPRT